MKLKQTMLHGAIFALASTAAVNAAADSQANAPSQEKIQPSKLFLQLDVNHDGYVSLDEAASVSGMEQNFSTADDDHDNRLTPGEFIKAESIHDRQQLSKYAQDSVITAKVKAVLFKDLELKAFDVGVETYRGRVLLSGFVEDPQQAQRAVQLAAGVRGVARVENALKVK